MGVPLVSDTMTIQFFIFIGSFSWCSLYNVQCPRDAAKERKLFSSMASTNKDITPCHCHKIKLIILFVLQKESQQITHCGLNFCLISVKL